MDEQKIIFSNRFEKEKFEDYKTDLGTGNTITPDFTEADDFLKFIQKNRRKVFQPSMIRPVCSSTNFYLTVDPTSWVVFLEHGVILQQLVDGVYTFAELDGIVGHQFIFSWPGVARPSDWFRFPVRKAVRRCQGRYKNIPIFRVTGDQVHTFICQVYTVQLFFDDEVQRVGSFVHTLVVLLHVDLFGLQHTCLDTLFTQIFNQCLVLGQCLVAAEQSKETFFLIFLVAGSNQALGIGKILGSQFLLCFHQTFYERTQLLEQLVLTFGDGTGNNQRSTGIVNQYGVHLVDDGIVVLALYEVFGAGGVLNS